jgi:adenylate cyclase
MSQNRQLAAIMFTDIVGYTRLMGNDEHKAFEMLGRNRTIQVPLIEKYGGRLIKELGDGMLASFTTVSDAVTAAIEIQNACNQQEDFSLRIGIHQGEIIFDNNDVFGDAVNIAARIQSAAPAGGILVSETVHLNVVNKASIQTEFFREDTLKNVSQPMKLYRVIMDMIIKTPEAPVTTYNPSSLKSIAVLPFVNMSNDPDQDFFSDGISEEILNSLTQVKQLKVAGRTSSFQFKGQNVDLREVGSKLNVTNVLEGSVRKHANRLRITAQLINVKDGYHLWSERFDRDIDDIFAIQEEIAMAITDKLKITLLDEEKQLVKKCCTHNSDAYQLYLKGRFYLSRRAKWVLRAIEFFGQAIKIDPSFAAAYAGLADAYFISSFYSLYPGVAVMKKGKEAADRSIQLDLTLPEPYSSLGYYYTALVRDPEKGKQNFEKALALNPAYTFARYTMALLYYTWTTGEVDKGIGHCKLALEQEPLSANIYSVYSLILIAAGKYQEALENANISVDLDENTFLGHRCITIATRKLGQLDQGLVSAQSLVTYSRRHPHAVLDLLEAYTALGDRINALKLYQELRTRADSEFINSACLGIAAADCNELDQAFEYFQKAGEERDPMLITLPYAGYECYEVLTKDQRFNYFINTQPAIAAPVELSKL